MKLILAIGFIVIVCIIIIYSIINLAMFTYKSNKEWKSFQENSIQQRPTFLSLSKELTKTSDVKKTSEIYQKRLNDFGHFVRTYM